MVHEIRPRVDWDKGKAVAWIREQLGQPEALPIVVGDDMTDEDAFDAFDDAITICVDPERPTAAKYPVDEPRRRDGTFSVASRAWNAAATRRVLAVVRDASAGRVTSA